MNSKNLIFKTLLIFSLLSTQYLFSQNAPIKFGKIQKGDLEITSEEKALDAPAVKLFDFAYVDFRFFEGISTITQRHYRIKILNEEGLEWADVEIPFYRNNRTKEKIGPLKAVVYNLENGQVVKTKLENKDIFDEQVDKNNFKKKFALPNVKVGSVIEVKYDILSGFWYEIDPWLFQRSIPVQRSELYISIPEYFIFNTNFKGYEYGNLSTNDKSTKSGRLNLGQGQNIDCQFTNYHWVAENIPAFTPEAYITTARNYLGRVEFELARTNFPNSINESYTTSWEAIAKQLASFDDFGATINRTNFLKDQAATLSAGATNPSQKVLQIYEGVKKMIKWDERYRVFASTADVKKAMKDRVGNSADINMTLICMFRAAGLEAYPVLVSTRSHGYLNQFQPSFDQFNHTIAAVKIGEGMLTLDATDPFVPADFTPRECLNEKGFLLVGEKYNWISLKPREKYKMAVQAKFALAEDGTLTGTIKEAKDGYAGYAFRKSFYGKGGTEKYIKAIQDNTEGLNIDKYEFKNESNLYKRAEANYEVTIADKVVSAGDMMYLSPMLHYALEENPFKLEERKYPVDYGHPYEEIYVFLFTLPKGYAVEELPKEEILVLPESAGKFTYTTKELGEMVQLTVRFTIDKTFFNFEQYPFLKEFYNLIVEKYGEQIVLKKKT